MITVDSNMDRVHEWLRMKNPEAGPIGAETDLIDNRLIDSLDFMEFVFLLEEITGRTNLLDGISVDAFRTLRDIKQNFL
jgi:acyl carrier protein